MSARHNHEQDHEQNHEQNHGPEHEQGLGHGPGQGLGQGLRQDGGHEELQVLLGAFVLGGLDAQDHRSFSRHLRSCPACQRQAAQLSGIPALLDLVEPSQLHEAESTGAGGPGVGTPVGVTVPPALLGRVRMARRRGRWRLGVAAAVLAVLAGGIGASIGPITSRVSAPPTKGLVVAAVAANGSSSAARVEVDLVTRTWGTQLDLRGSSLPTGEVLYLSVTSRDGRTYDVASWTGTPTGRATLTAACWMRPADIAAVTVHTRSGSPVATATA